MKKVLQFLISGVISLSALNAASAQNCQAGFNYTVNNGTVQFTNTSTGITGTPYYYWSFSNSLYSTLTNPSQLFTNGTYLVCMQLIDSSMSNSCYSYFCDTIVITNSQCNLSVTVTTTDESVCGAGDGTATAVVSGGTPPYTYTWQNTNFIGPTITGLYSGGYGPVVIDATGCAERASGIVGCTGNLGCQAAFGYYTVGSTVYFDNNSGVMSNLTSVTWDFGDNTTSTSPFSEVHTYSSDGSYLVCLHIYDSLQNCTSSFCDTVIINTQPNYCSLSFALVQDSLAPLLWYAYPAATGTAPFTYFWDFGDGNLSTLASPSHTYATPGQYTLCLTITDATGCSNTYCDSSSVRAMQLAMQYLQVMPFTTGIQEHENLAGKVAPNPADEFIDITLEKEIKGTVRITDMLGNTLLENNMQNRSSRIDISMLPAGYYTVTVFTANGSMNKKVAIVRQ